MSYCSVIPWTSFTQSFCSLSDRQMTLVGGGVEGRSYTLWTPGGSSKQNLQNRGKDFLCNSRVLLCTDTKTNSVPVRAKQMCISPFGDCGRGFTTWYLKAILCRIWEPRPPKRRKESLCGHHRGVSFSINTIFSFQFLLTDVMLSIKSQGF